MAARARPPTRIITAFTRALRLSSRIRGSGANMSNDSSVDIWDGAGCALAVRTPVEIAMPDGDRLVVLDSIPDGMEGAAARRRHGARAGRGAGSTLRRAACLAAAPSGVRVVRVNLRGAGGVRACAGHLSRGAKRRFAQVMNWLASQVAASPIALVGFSLGANLVLKLASESAALPVPNFDCVIAANPPLDLAACAKEIERP